MSKRLHLKLNFLVKLIKRVIFIQVCSIYILYSIIHVRCLYQLFLKHVFVAHHHRTHSSEQEGVCLPMERLLSWSKAFQSAVHA